MSFSRIFNLVNMHEFLFIKLNIPEKKKTDFPKFWAAEILNNLKTTSHPFKDQNYSMFIRVKNNNEKFTINEIMIKIIYR